MAADTVALSALTLARGDKILVTVESALPDIIVVSFVHGAKCFQGALLDATKSLNFHTRKSVESFSSSLENSCFLYFHNVCVRQKQKQDGQRCAIHPRHKWSVSREGTKRV